MLDAKVEQVLRGAGQERLEDGGAAAQQEQHDVLVAHRRGDHQRRQPIAVLRIDFEGRVEADGHAR